MLELFVGTLVYKKLLNKLAVIALPHYQFTLTLLGGNDSHNFWSLSLPSPKLTHSLKYSSYNGTKTHLKAHKIERLLGFLSDVCAGTYFLCGHLFFVGPLFFCAGTYCRLRSLFPIPRLASRHRPVRACAGQTFQKWKQADQHLG